MQKWDNQKTKDLITVILALKNAKEAKLFLRDILTEKELLELGNRWKAVRMLSSKISYTEITKETGLSSKTVARISQWLKNGMGGYAIMLKKISKTHHTALPQPRKC